MQCIQRVQSRRAVERVRLICAELDYQAEDVAQYHESLDLLVVLGDEVPTGDLTIDTVARLHEVRGEDRLEFH